MFLLSKPTVADISRFLDRARDMPLSYAQPGMASRPPAGFKLDDFVATIGSGHQDFSRAREALFAWKHYEFDWVEAVPHRPSTEPGSVFGVAIRHLGIWSLNGGRVLERFDRTDDRMSCGFSYGTLADHAECGEELFEVFLDPETGEVKYRIRAVSRPRALLARLGGPVVRLLQARFRRDSAAAMTRAVRVR
jgi:uncharacterized protein (UPF0548 family)